MRSLILCLFLLSGCLQGGGYARSEPTIQSRMADETMRSFYSDSNENDPEQMKRQMQQMQWQLQDIQAQQAWEKACRDNPSMGGCR